jgi:ubiquinone/menaquinone biosynthesis C-methylase UbiE
MAKTFWELAAETKMGAYLTGVELSFVDEALMGRQSLLVDVGSGAGKFSVFAFERGFNVVAVDLSLQGLKRLRFLCRGIDCVLADARALPFKSQVASAVTMIEVLDYVPELNAVLAECKRILRLGGVLCFSFGNSASLKAKARWFFGKKYRHSFKKVVQNLSMVGLFVGKMQGFNWLPFNRTSNSCFVPFMTKVERVLRKRGFASVSPWVLIEAY